jgi:epoxyqueuosine reductase
LLDALTEAFAGQGLYVVRPFALDAAGPAGAALAEALPAARTGLIVGDGGGDFFARFSALASDDDGPDPLDRYTAGVVNQVLAGLSALLPRGSHAVRFPFQGALPMQQLGEAAGLPRPGPLGLQIHPRFGPWWGYRAVVVLGPALPALPALGQPCRGCPAPCVAACPASAVRAAGLAIETCARHRLVHAPCAHDCVARRACVVAPERAYPADQLAFHMEASLSMVRAYFVGPPSGPPAARRS